MDVCIFCPDVLVGFHFCFVFKGAAILFQLTTLLLRLAAHKDQTLAFNCRLFCIFTFAKVFLFLKHGYFFVLGFSFFFLFFHFLKKYK